MTTYNPNSKPVTHKVSENTAYNRAAYKALRQSEKAKPAIASPYSKYSH